MTIEEFEERVMEIFEKNIDEANKERMRWFIVKVKGEYRQKRVSVTSCILDTRFQMHTIVVGIKDNYEDAFLEVIEGVENKFKVEEAKAEYIGIVDNMNKELLSNGIADASI